MKYIKYIFLFISTLLFSQNSISTSFIKKNKLQETNLAKIDNFNNYYFTSDNTIIKQTDNNKFVYNNMQLGEVSTFDVFNALKINVFYKDFNTVVILDNRLSEVSKIDFNLKKPFRNISHVSTGYDNTIWCFNQDTQQLELFDYRTNTTRAKTLPINGNIIQITSNYNNCWVVTEAYIYQFNYFGSQVSKIKNEGYSNITEINENLYLQKDNELFFKPKNSTEISPINLPKLLIKQFFVTNETLYIYDDEFLHQYQLINE